MMDAVIDEIDGRMIRVGDQWLADFASCNYLGFDLDPRDHRARPGLPRAVGHASELVAAARQPRAVRGDRGAPHRAARAPRTRSCLPTITHIHMSVIPLLAASGTIFLDARAHKTIYDGCQIAKARGAAVRRFRFEDPDHLDALLSQERDPTRLVCMDGVNSMTGNAPDLVAFAEVARRHGALLYVDDAHGFGVIGERAADEPCPYGVRGNSIVRHAGESYDNVVLVGGFSKAYSSLLAFIACPTRREGPAQGRRAAVPVLGPLAGGIARDRDCGLRRERGARRRAARAALAAVRARARRRCARSASRRRTAPAFRSSRCRSETIGASTRSGASCSIEASTSRWPRIRSSPRTRSDSAFSSRRANTDDEVDTLIAALEELAADGELRPRGRGARGGGMTARAAPRQHRLAGVDRVPRRRSAHHGAVPVRPAFRRQRAGDERARPRARARDRGGRPDATARRRGSRGLCVALGFLLFWLGDLYTYSYPLLLDRDVPFPSIGDAAYLAVYPALIAGLVILQRRRTRRGDRGSAIDAAILTVGLGAPVVGLADRAVRPRSLAHDGRADSCRWPTRWPTCCCWRSPCGSRWTAGSAACPST